MPPSSKKASVRRAADRLRAALDKSYMPHLQPRPGVVQAVEYGPAGPIRASVGLGGGVNVTLEAAGKIGVEKGAEVRVYYAGGRPLFWEVARLVSASAAGAPSTPISTPAIDSVTTVVDQGAASTETLAGRGTAGSIPSPTAQGFVLVRRVPEQQADVRVRYEIEIRDTTTGRLAWSSTSTDLGMARASVAAPLAVGTGAGGQVEIGAWQGGWPNGAHVVTLGDLGTPQSEHVWIEGPPVAIPPGLSTYRLPFAGGTPATLYALRNYHGPAFPEGATAPQAWPVGTAVTVTSSALSFTGLAVNRAYQVRVRARGLMNGSESNWSSWHDFSTANDTTPPGWSITPVTPTVEVTERAFTVRWPPADVYHGGIMDLARYEVGVSEDGLTWDMRNAGNGTLWVESAPYGSTRQFRVRAVDTSGNASAWSNIVTARLATSGDPPGANILANPTFATNASDWSLASLSGTATLTRVTDVFYDAPGAARLKDTRSAIMSTAELTSSSVAITAGRLIYLRAYVRTEGAISGDTLSLVLKLTGVGTHTASAHVEATKIGSDWTRLSAMIEAPAAATHAAAILSWTIAAGFASSPHVWLDDVALIEVEPGTPAAVMWGHLTSDPGGEARPLATDADGGIALHQLKLGAGGATLVGYLSATKTWDPPSLANGAGADTTVTVAGAAVGDLCVVGFSSIAAAGWLLSASVTAANTVAVTLYRAYGGTSDLGSGTLRVGVLKAL